MTNGFLGALAFLTRVPVPVRPGGARTDLARTVPWFPVVGFLVGVATAGAYAAGARFVSPVLAATLAVAVQIVLTGALHEDGLADSADALGASSPQERLRIMRDPGHGTFGVLALVLSTGTRVAALAGLGSWTAAAALAGAGALGRAAAGALLAHPAAGPGSAASHRAGLRPSAVRVCVTGGVVLATLAMGAWAAPALALAGVVAGVASRWSRRALGGVTGDVLGAVVVLCECAVLALASGAAAGGGPAIAWWRG